MTALVPSHRIHKVVFLCIVLHFGKDITSVMPKIKTHNLTAEKISYLDNESQ